MPIKSLTSLLKRSKISGHLLLRDSKDPLVSNSAPTLKSGLWKVEGAVKTAEAELAVKSAMGTPQFGRAGLGMRKGVRVPKTRQCHAYRKLISETAKDIDEETHMGRALQLQVQGQWSRWENYIKNDLSWNSILAMSPNLLSFCLASTFDVLPSPSNLKRWKISTESSCSLCNKQICTTAHVLGACKVALSQGRFTFRHDSVLQELLSNLKEFRSNIAPSSGKNFQRIPFVKAGTRTSGKRSKPTGLLHLADDWVILSDLSDGFVFPGHIAITALRPDMVIYSNCSKIVILIELTCPCEENMVSWHSTKLSKYSPWLK